jgi:hypothetical protein
MVGALGFFEGVVTATSVIVAVIRKNRLLLLPGVLAMISMLCFIGIFFSVLHGGLP